MPYFPFTRAPSLQRHSRAILTVAAAVYLAVTSAFLVTHGSWPTPDFLIPPLILLAVAYGRGWQFVIDWAPFLLLMLAYEAFRGMADNLNTRVHIVELIDADKWLLGTTAPNWLQERFFRLDRVTWYDWVASVLHMAHFVVPVAVGFVIWTASRVLYWRYAAAILALFFAGFVSYYLYPAAPPWMAGDLGLIPHVERVLIHTLVRLPATQGISLAYEHFSPNVVAAMPSLHAALPMLVSFMAISLLGRRALPLLLYPLAGGLSWMYLGEHYLVDVLAGWLYAVAVFLMVWLGAPRLARRARTAAASARIEALATAVRVPSWPLGLASVAFIALVWVNPLVQAPIRPGQGALIPDAGVRVGGVLEAASIVDLQPADCAADRFAARAEGRFAGPSAERRFVRRAARPMGGRSTALLVDRALNPLVAEYGVYVQGLRSSTCLSLSARRSVAALTPEELRLIDIESASLGPVVLDLPGSPYLTLVQAGHPADIVESIFGVSSDDVLVVVLRVSPTEAVEGMRQAVASIAALALSRDDAPLVGIENCGGECPETPEAAIVQPEPMPEPSPETTEPEEDTPEPMETPTPEVTPTPTPSATPTPTATPTPVELPDLAPARSAPAVPSVAAGGR